MGYDMQEGTVVRWLKPEGSEVQMGEPVAEIETDKAVVEFESYAEGILHKILVPEGSVVPVGRPIAIVGDVGEPISEDTVKGSLLEDELPALSEEITPVPSGVNTSVIAAPPQETPAPEGEVEQAPVMEIRASPVARRLADEHGIKLSEVIGTGPGGRITKEDVLSLVATPAATKVAALETIPPPVEVALEPVPADVAPSPIVEAAGPDEAPAPSERVPLSRMRQQIARVTVRSKQEKPHFYVSSEIDMSEAMALRQQINSTLESEGTRVSVNDLIVKACVEALKIHPKFNAFFTEDGIQMNESINIGIAISEEQGLIVPAIMESQNKSLKEIALASKDLAQRARNGALHPQEYTGGTFAISNLGMFDVSSFVAIIHPPQSAVLAIGTVAKKPVVRDDQLTIAQMMTATLSADHRIVDGAEGARFIVEVKRLLEAPLHLVL
jgi:pyruvate dehydrogenase E2 component (dihydrolipoamide acetyltransferase)